MLPPMVFEEIALEEIDVENETFRISEDLDSARILDSLRKIGQLNPVVLLELKPQPVIVNGFRRIRAMMRLGISRSLARVLSSEEFDTTRAFELAVWDNVSHRELNPLEKARILFKLRHVCGIPDEKIIATWLPILGLASGANVLRSHLLLHEIHSGLRQCLVDGRLTHTSLEYLAEMSSSAQESIASLMGKIRLSASLQKKLLGVLNDLRGMTGNAFEAPLKDPQIVVVLEDAALSAFQKGEKIYDRLYRQLNPRLSQAGEKFVARKKRLGVPGSIRINAHPYFEERGLRVEFEAPDAEQFRLQADALHKAAQSPDLDGLFDLDSE
jgi:hypothetical protein